MFTFVPLHLFYGLLIAFGVVSYLELATAYIKFVSAEVLKQSNGKIVINNVSKLFLYMFVWLLWIFTFMIFIVEWIVHIAKGMPKDG